MKRISFLLLATTCITSFAWAQKSAGKSPVKKSTAVKTPAPAVLPASPWVFTYGPDTVYKSEFERLLSKNKKDKETPTEADVREYLELYENFKMKVKEAERMKLDTNTAFITELAGYRKQLANPYLTDKKVTEGLIQEAYERMKTEVNASHILINCSENASAKDTLEAYSKIMDLRKRFLKGESFDSLAAKNSEDPSAVKNYGVLGWFSSFQMIYPFETQAYNTPKGQVSMPFRTRFGYHIVKVNNIRPARGEVKVTHIMLQTGPSATSDVQEEARLKADSAYKKLLAGEPFEKVVEEYSQDQASKTNGGAMNYFSSFSNYPEPFKEMAFSLDKGELSKPFKTDYGYHIIKVVDKKPIPELKEVEESIKNKIGRDSRAESSKLVVAQRIKRENSYKEYPANMKEFIASVDSSFLQASWTPDEKKLNDKPVMSLNDKNYSVREFADYVKVYQEPRANQSIQMVINGLFKKFADEKALEYEENMLEAKYADFRNLMQEYHDGILLFDLTDKQVWNKAVIDSAGLEKFHSRNSDKYMWKERLRVSTYTSVDAKTKKEAMKMAAAGKTADEIKARLNKKVAGSVTITESKAERTEAGETAKLWDKKGVVDIPNDGGNFKFYVVEGIVGPEAKTLKEARGLATSDYQTYLEKEWITELRSKYPVSVNESTVKSLFK